MEALRTNHQDAEAIEDWDPGAAPGGNDLVWRAQLLASDRTGALHRSWSAVNRARSLARTPDEIFRALELRARVECDLQWHTQELADARRLVSLRPDSLDSLLILRRAALCNQLPGLAKQVAARKAALEQTREHP